MNNNYILDEGEKDLCRDERMILNLDREYNQVEEFLQNMVIEHRTKDYRRKYDQDERINP